MNSHSIQVLELPKLLRQFAAMGATSWFGPKFEAGFEDFFLGDSSSAAKHFASVHAVANLLGHPKFPGFATVEDFAPILEEVLPQGAVLGSDAFEILIPALHASQAAAEFGDADRLAEDWDLDKQSAEILAGFLAPLRVQGLLKYLGAYLDGAGKLMDDKIPALAAIRKRMQRINQDILATAKSFLSGAAYYSSDTPVFRDGRVLLPLKQDFRGRVEGIYHGTSDSGGTIYVEPEALLSQNNGLAEAQAQYAREVHRIYRELSAAIRNESDALRAVHSAWEALDRILIPARWLRQTDGKIPVLGAEEFFLSGVRHPLLGSRAIPIDIRFEDKRIIIITGPNTGGKTVALKTLGLSVLLARLGFSVPATGEVRIPWIDSVLADIGDEQSIEAALSTFSAHLKNIGDIVQEAGPDSVVLLDELGTGTDPQEGGALALAVLEELLDIGCYALVTTHHKIVKAFAYQHEKVENASMEFDDATKSPSFRVRYGLPGESRALETARRVAFPAKVLERAYQYADGAGTSLEKLVEGLTKTKQELDEQIESARRKENSAEELRTRLEDERRQLEAEKLALKEDHVRETNAYLAEARRRIEEEIRAFNEAAIQPQNHAAKEASKRLRAAGAELTEAAREMESEVKQKRKASQALPTLAAGMEVRVRGTTQRGQLVERRKDGRWTVAAGMVKIALNPEEIEPVAEAEPRPKYYQPEAGQSSYVGGGRTGSPKFTMDLRGMRLEQALSEVQGQIDSAAVHGLTFFAIIHGKGTGALQKGIHDLLAATGVVRDFHFARPEDGGTGKTLVYLRED